MPMLCAKRQREGRFSVDFFEGLKFLKCQKIYSDCQRTLKSSRQSIGRGKPMNFRIFWTFCFDLSLNELEVKSGGHLLLERFIPVFYSCVKLGHKLETRLMVARVWRRHGENKTNQWKPEPHWNNSPILKTGPVAAILNFKAFKFPRVGGHI